MQIASSRNCRCCDKEEETPKHPLLVSYNGRKNKTLGLINFYREFTATLSPLERYTGLTNLIANRELNLPYMIQYAQSKIWNVMAIKISKAQRGCLKTLAAYYYFLNSQLSRVNFNNSKIITRNLCKFERIKTATQNNFTVNNTNS